MIVGCRDRITRPPARVTIAGQVTGVTLLGADSMGDRKVMGE